MNLSRRLRLALIRARPNVPQHVGDGTGSSDGLNGGSDGGSGGDTDGGSGDDTGGGGDTGGETDGGDFGGDGVPMGDASGGTETVAFTTTYTLEANVDEYDVVKYNGSQLFIAPSRGMDCCVMFEDEVAFDGLDDGDSDDGGSDDGGSDDGGSDDGGAEGAATDSTDVAGDVLEMPVRGIRVLTTDAVNGLAQETHRIPLAEDQSVEGLYLVDRNLIALTSTAWWGRHGDQFARPEGWLNQSVGLESFDLDEDFSARHSIRVEGALVNSRRTEAGIFPCDPAHTRDRWPDLLPGESGRESTRIRICWRRSSQQIFYR